MPRLDRELLGLTGEYAVASELCRRGVYCQLTLGNHKRTDLLVETETRMIRIQVKTKQGPEWPGIAGLYREDDFLVLVDLKGKHEGVIEGGRARVALRRRVVERHPPHPHACR